jgi:hypothetical protein
MFAGVEQGALPEVAVDQQDSFIGEGRRTKRAQHRRESGKGTPGRRHQGDETLGRRGGDGEARVVGGDQGGFSAVGALEAEIGVLAEQRGRGAAQHFFGEAGQGGGRLDADRHSGEGKWFAAHEQAGATGDAGGGGSGEEQRGG